ncbi:hypothetical protein DNH61_24540 [Paenibacillus sambharensis]|uniref:Lipocalin-like domain-containing protein n=1 Tax=Paenibacillus sambharensis TaxID=1803190 RepID=A0A2W1LP78_9BACL|nr:hypothetical protein [Paenibacillus sambharensis]PZD93217.1 hypothetical protein DNH61_24540 [Paenibacillus sambharensis]
MNKIFRYSTVPLILLLMLLVSACGGNTNTNAPAEPPENSAVDPTDNLTNETTGNDSDTGSEATPGNAGTNSGGTEGSAADAADENPDTAAGSEDAPSFFGEWTISKHVGSTGVSTEPNSGITGLTVVYNANKASVGQNEVQSPVYEEYEMTKEAFLMEYRVELSDIGIESESVKTIVVANWNGGGSFIILRDEQPPIVLIDGNFYELEKAES